MTTTISDAFDQYTIAQLAVISGLSTTKLREVAAQSTPPAGHPGPGRKWLFQWDDAAALLDLANGH